MLASNTFIPNYYRTEEPQTLVNQQTSYLNSYKDQLVAAIRYVQPTPPSDLAQTIEMRGGMDYLIRDNKG